MSVKTTTDSDFTTILQENEKVIVKYFADWCGTCKLMSPKYKSWSEEDRFKQITFLEINAEKNREARKLAGVDSLPYFAIFKLGKLIDGACIDEEELVLALLEKLV